MHVDMLTRSCGQCCRVTRYKKKAFSAVTFNLYNVFSLQAYLSTDPTRILIILCHNLHTGKANMLHEQNLGLQPSRSQIWEKLSQTTKPTKSNGSTYRKSCRHITFERYETEENLQRTTYGRIKEGVVDVL
jgi:hypothetical protein